MGKLSLGDRVVTYNLNDLVLRTILRQDAIVSAQWPLDELDACPEDVFNRILWRAMKGPETPYPIWAVTAVDDD